MNAARPSWIVMVLLVSLSLLGVSSAHASCTDRPTPGVDCSNCGKTRLLLYDRDFTGGKFDGTNFSGSDLSRAKLTDASFIKADLTRATLNEAVLEGADLAKALGHRAELDQAVFTRANLAKSEFTRATFIQANLAQADLSKGDFGRAVFREAVLRDANLAFSNFSRASFADADLGGADLTGAYTYLSDFSGVNLSTVGGLTQAQIDNDVKGVLPPQARDGADADVTAGLVVSLFEGAALQLALDPDAFDMDAYLARMGEILRGFS